MRTGGATRRGFPAPVGPDGPGPGVSASNFVMTRTSAPDRPKVPRGLLLGLTALLLVACGGGGGGGGTPAGPPPEPPPPTQTELDFASDVLDLVNLERTSRGLDPLDPDAGAAEAAFAHANDMYERGFFDHVNPNGEDPGDRMDRAGVNGNGWGENIARGQPTPGDVMDSWMASPGHRANILEPSFGRLGVGVRLELGGPWWVQNFVAP